MGHWEAEMPSRCGILRHFLFFLMMACLFHESCFANAADEAANGSSEMKLQAVPGFGNVLLSENRRRLGSFQICALCTCCGGPRGLCLPSPCCYAINCNIPNRPFGFCSFTPKACNCFGCSL